MAREVAWVPDPKPGATPVAVAGGPRGPAWTQEQIDELTEVSAQTLQQTGEDRTQTGLDRSATSQDRTATGLDRTATGEDRAAAEEAADNARQFGAAVIYRTWADLALVTGAPGETAVVFSDEDDHTDPVVGGTVSNSGYFAWSASPAGWQRFANTQDADAKAQADRAQAAADDALDAIRSFDPFAPQSEADHTAASARIYGVSATYADEYSVARGVSRLALSAAWAASEFAADILARTSSGLALSPEAQNLFPDTWMSTGAAGQAPSGMSFAGVAPGITATVVGTGAEAGLPYVDVRWSGVATGNGTATAFFAANGQVPALNGEQFNWWQPIKKVSIGDGIDKTPNLAMLTQNSVFTTNGTQFDGGLASTAVFPDHVEADVQSWSVPNATAAFIRPYMYFGIKSGEVLDLTLRFYPGVLTKGTKSATWPIKTQGVSGVIANDNTYPNVAPNTASSGSSAPSTLPTSWAQGGSPASGFTRTVLAPVSIGGNTFAAIRFQGSNASNQAHVLYLGNLTPAGSPITGQTWLVAAEMAVADAAAVASMRNLQLAIAERASGSDLQTSLTSVKDAIATTPKTFSVSRTVTEATATNVRGAIYFQTTGDVAVDITIYVRLVWVKNVSTAPQPVGSIVQTADTLITVNAPSLTAPYSVGLWARAGQDAAISGVRWVSDDGQDSIELTRDSNRQAHLIFRHGGITVKDENLGSWADGHVIKVAARVGISTTTAWRSGRAASTFTLTTPPTGIEGLKGTPTGAMDLLRQASYPGLISDLTGADYVGAPERQYRFYGDSLTLAAALLGTLPRHNAPPGWGRRALGRPCFNGGIAGQTSTQIVDRLVADAMIGPGDVVVLGCGQNNITQLSTIMADIARAKAYCDTKGATLIYWAPITSIDSTPVSSGKVNRDTIEAAAVALLGADHVALVQDALVSSELNTEPYISNLTFGPALRYDKTGLGDLLHLDAAASEIVWDTVDATADGLGLN